MRWSIRWRLTLWNTLALAVVLAGFSALVYGLLARSLYQQIDQGLLAAFQGLEKEREVKTRAWLQHEIKEFKEHQDFFCVVYDGAGSVYERTEELAAESVPPGPPLAAGEPRFEDLTLPVISRQRALSGRLRLGDEAFTVFLLAPLEAVDRECAQSA